MRKGSTCLFLVSPQLIKGCFIEPLLQRKTRHNCVLFGPQADKAVDQWFSRVWFGLVS